MDGHAKEGCFKFIGYFDQYKSKNKAFGQSFQQSKTIENGSKIGVVVEESFTEEDNPLEPSDATSKIDELSVILSSQLSTTGGYRDGERENSSRSTKQSDPTQDPCYQGERRH